jgi:hypothetical protein
VGELAEIVGAYFWELEKNQMRVLDAVEGIAGFCLSSRET